MKNLYEILTQYELTILISTLVIMVAGSIFNLRCFVKEINAKNAVKYLKKTDLFLFIGIVTLTLFFAIKTLIELILGYKLTSIILLILSSLLMLMCKAELNDTKQKEEQYIALIEKNEKKKNKSKGDRV